MACTKEDVFDTYLVELILTKRLNSLRTCYKTHVLLFQSQHATSFNYMFKNKHNHTQSTLIPIYKTNEIGNFIEMLCDMVGCIEF